MMGRTVGASRGKGGTMHIAKPEAGVMLSTGIVGAGPPVAVGLAMAAKRKGIDRVTVVSFGDGATNTGSFHEAANMAALWDLPVVFVCQNNLYAEMTPTRDTMKIEHVADRAAGYGMPGVRVDGNDPLAVVEALAEALGQARNGDGPTFIECVTFRFRGHYFGDRQQVHARGAAGGGDGGRPGAALPQASHRHRGVHRRRAQRHRRRRTDRRRIGPEDGHGRRGAIVDELDRDVYATPIRIPRLRKIGHGREEEMTMREALNLALDQALEADDRVFLLGEDIADPGASGPTAGLSTKYGHDRVLDTPISEAAIVGAAIGAAIDGMLPVAEIMIMDFIGIAADQLINNAAKLRFMTAGTDDGADHRAHPGVRRAGHRRHALADRSRRGSCTSPGMKVIIPSTPRDGKGLLTSAIFDEDPCLFIETIRLQGQKGLVPTDPGFAIPLGKADVKRPGTDVSIIGYGRSVQDALKAADKLATNTASAPRSSTSAPSCRSTSRPSSNRWDAPDGPSSHTTPCSSRVREPRSRPSSPPSCSAARGADRAGRRQVRPDAGSGRARGCGAAVGRADRRGRRCGR